MMKFTVLIDSLTRDRNDLFVSVIEAKTLADIEFAAVADYNRQHGDEMAFAEHEAVLIALCAGDVQFAWNPDGLNYSEISYDIMAGRLVMPSTAPLFGQSAACRTSSRQDGPELQQLPGCVSKQVAAGMAYHQLAESLLPVKYSPAWEDFRKYMTNIPTWAIRPIDHDAQLNNDVVYHCPQCGRDYFEPLDSCPSDDCPSVNLETVTVIEDIKQNVRQKARFPEVDKLAIISTSHLSAENLRALEAQELNGDLDYWIVPTGFGYIIRFETAVQNWEAACDGGKHDVIHPFRDAHLDDTFSALCVELKDYGFNGMHLDADADEIDGLTTYEHS